MLIDRVAQRATDAQQLHAANEHIFQAEVVVQLQGIGLEPVQGRLVERVAAAVLPVRALAEGIGGGDQHEVGVLPRDRVVGAIGHRQVAVVDPRVQGDQHVLVGGVQLVEQEHTAVLVAIDERRRDVLERSALADRQEASEELTFGHPDRARDGCEVHVERGRDLLAERGLAAPGRADQQARLTQPRSAQSAAERRVRATVDLDDLLIAVRSVGDLETIGLEAGNFLVDHLRDRLG